MLERIDDNNLVIGGAVKVRVVSISDTAASTDIASGQMILSVDAAGPIDSFANIQVGDELAIETSCADKRWCDVTYACGGGDILVSDGSVTPSLKAGADPRTAVGIKRDGTVVLLGVGWP